MSITDETTETLERYYQSFASAEQGISRFPLLDCLEYIRGTEELMVIIQPLEKEKEWHKKWFDENKPKANRTAGGGRK